jgi:hypothetical protein
VVIYLLRLPLQVHLSLVKSQCSDEEEKCNSAILGSKINFNSETKLAQEFQLRVKCRRPCPFWEKTIAVKSELPRPNERRDAQGQSRHHL